MQEPVEPRPRPQPFPALRTACLAARAGLAADLARAFGRGSGSPAAFVTDTGLDRILGEFNVEQISRRKRTRASQRLAGSIPNKRIAPRQDAAIAEAGQHLAERTDFGRTALAGGPAARARRSARPRNRSPALRFSCLSSLRWAAKADWNRCAAASTCRWAAFSRDQPGPLQPRASSLESLRGPRHAGMGRLCRQAPRRRARASIAAGRRRGAAPPAGALPLGRDAGAATPEGRHPPEALAP